MAYTNFNRHESMSKEVFEQIGTLLNEELYKYEITTEQRRSVTNELFGLYDGYLYESLLSDADKLPDPVRTQIKNVCHACSLYPYATTQVF